MRRLKKCIFCKRKESKRLIGSISEGVCSWCYTKHPPIFISGSTKPINNKKQWKLSI